MLYLLKIQLKGLKINNRYYYTDFLCEKQLKIIWNVKSSAMKLLKSEKCAIIITLVFLALVLGFTLGRGQRDASFVISESAFAAKTESVAGNGSSEDGNGSGRSDESYIININSATAEELERLDGIGPVIAERIVSYREQEGEFKSIEDITKVQGIGAATFEDIRGHICID